MAHWMYHWYHWKFFCITFLTQLEIVTHVAASAERPVDELLPRLMRLKLT